MNIKEKTIDERINDLTVQFQLLLAKEIERNKELDKEREQREKERIERKEREAKELVEREEREAKELAERKELEAKYAREQVERDARWEAKLEKARIEREEREKERKQAEEAYRKRMDKQFGEFTNSYGREAEVLFYRSLDRTRKIANIEFDRLFPNMKPTKKSRQYDMVLVNGEYVALVEVKRSAKLEDLETLVEVQAKAFRNEMPEYKDKKLICVLAFFQCDDNLIPKAKEKGVCVIFKNGFHIKQDYEKLKLF